MYKYIILLLISLLLLFSCSSEVIGYRLDNFLFDIKNGRWETIDSLNLVNVRLKSLKNLEKYLGDGAAYFLALRRYERADFRNYELLMLYQMKNGTKGNIYRTLAADHLAKWYISKEDWDRLAAISNDPDTMFHSAAEKEQFQITAMYRREEFTRIAASFPLHDIMTEESRLYVLVALYNTGSPAFTKELVDFAVRTADNSLLYRLYLYILNKGIDIPDGTPRKALAQARLFGAAEEYKPAAFLYRKAWEENNADFISETVYRGFAEALLQAGEFDFFRSALKKLADRPDTGLELFNIIYMDLGSLERNFSNYNEAAKLYKYVYYSSNGHMQKRALWYWFDCMARGPEKDYIDNLPFLFRRWKDPPWYDDTFEYYSAFLLRNGRYQDLYNFYVLLKDKASRFTVSRLVWILFLLEHYDIWSGGENFSAGLDSVFADPGTGHFYRMLYRILSGDDIVIHGKRDAGDSVKKHADNTMISSLLLFRLSDAAYQSCVADPTLIGTEELTSLSLLLAREKKHYKSLNLMIDAAGRPDFCVNDSTLRALYPLAYDREIRTAGKSNNIPEPLFFALIREESLFNNTIGSRAGALGLSQLMPATADEVAIRLSLGDYDIFDPDTNLKIGSWYLSYTRERNDDYSRALFAYNAGPTKIKNWKKEFGHLPAMLFMEAIPIWSTRRYVRNIFVSAQLYNYIYFNYDSRYLSEFFFSDIADFKLRQRN